MSNEIINRVAQSTLVTIDLEKFYVEGERVFYDLKQNLYQELILKERDFRDFIKAHDWMAYSGKLVAIGCSVDTVIPTWAYMLIASKLKPIAKRAVLGTLETIDQVLFQEAIAAIIPEEYENAKVVIKGCSKYEVPNFAYVEIVNKLQPYVSSMMFGEACSSVPVFKRPKGS